jgi:hypothetical protein
MTKSSKILLPSVLSCAVVGLMATSAVLADPVKKATTVTFSAPTEIPGMVLPAGTYVMKIPDPYTHSDMVGFYDTKEAHLYKLVRTVAAYRTVRTADTVITFEERAAGAPQAIHTWFFPADFWGREFVYGKAAEFRTVAETLPPPPVAAPAPPVAEAPAPAPEPAPAEAQAQQPEAQQSEAQVEIAQAAPPSTPVPAPVETAPNQPIQELPKTGSELPLVLTAGSFLALAGLLLRLKA